MDNNWCAVCFQHIDFSDDDLYCSEACKKNDEVPVLDKSYNGKLSPTEPTDCPSPLIGALKLPSPYFKSWNPRLSPPAFNLDSAAPTFTHKQLNKESLTIYPSAWKGSAFKN
ncbi:hypothetical protein K502DRAFT_345347 [Neoconidiobolus thromboides FSU 785]|nr:hypothetical protein K502DRAFT_345347 [Neoconidiobolus thromboides FSU 785]